MIPETGADKKIRLLKCTKWPNEWIEFKTLLEDIDAYDCTHFYMNQTHYLLVYSVVENNRVLEMIDIFDSQTKKKKLVEYNNEDNQSPGRPAGNFIFEKDKIIRCVQPSISFYGEKVEFYNCVFSKTFKERKIAEINSTSFSLNSHMKYDGVHTYNYFNGVEVIDLVIKKRVNVFKPFRLLFQKLHVFGYGKYDLERKKVF